MRNVIRGEHLKANRFKTLPVLPWVAICIAALWMFLRAETVTGEQFKQLMDDSARNSMSTWYLYSDHDDFYCFRTPRPPWPDKRYCVAKSELEIIKAPNEPLIDFVGEGELALKAERYPGAKRIVF